MNNTIKKMLLGAVMAVTAMSLVACTDVITNTDVPIIGDLPDGITAKYSINKNMSAIEMYEAGLANYDDLSYVSTLNVSTIASKAFGMNVTQSLSSTKIKENGNYYLDCETFTTSGIKKVHFVDQSKYINGMYTIRSGDKFKVTDVIGTVEEWKPTEIYSGLDAALAKYPNDPTRMNMYIVNSGTIVSSTTPIQDAKTGQYSYSMILDNDTATVDYVKNMEYNTSNDSLTAGAKIKFTGLKLEVVMWGNGLIKSIGIDESYDLEAGFISSKTNNMGMTYYNYDKDNVGMRISDQDVF